MVRKHLQPRTNRKSRALSPDPRRTSPSLVKRVPSRITHGLPTTASPEETLAPGSDKIGLAGSRDPQIGTTANQVVLGGKFGYLAPPQIARRYVGVLQATYA